MADFNGITLPEISAEVLEDKPWATVVHMAIEAYAVDMYGLMLVDEPLYYFPPAITGDVIGFLDALDMKANAIMYIPSEDGTAWEQSGEAIVDASMDFPIGEISEDEVTYKYEVVWSNHNVMTVALDADGNAAATSTVYFPGEGVIVPPEKYKLYRTVIKRLANKIRELTGLTVKMDQFAMADNLESVTAASDPVLESITITENGVYAPGTSCDGYDQITVNVEAEAPASSGLSFDSSASGCIPDYDHGYAESELALTSDMFTSSATGTVS